jgi:nitrate/TMAO reductase-like tetraheme cytochrome c subunit
MRYPLILLLAAVPLAANDSCLTCHSGMEGELQKPAEAFGSSVHAQEGFTCADCHGGDPNTDDPTAAMSAAHGFIGVPARAAIPKLCARCHSDPNFMRKYNPRERVDQYSEYLTSVHGQRLRTGDTAVATCIDCHSVHDIRPVRDPLSPVYPLRIPGTCAQCHANAAHMAKYSIPTNQYAEYLKSAHWEELSQRGDLSAPTCVTCHGNHGAKPPEVSSVEAVCGTCHALEEQRFEKSPHQAAFAAMKLGTCVVCHSNHAVLRTSDQMLSGANAVCGQCHAADSAGGKAAAEMADLIRNLQDRLKQADEILAVAQNDGMEVSAAIAQQTEARQNLVKARSEVHAFAVAAMAAPVNTGLAIAATDYRAGENALHERNVRREGLAISLFGVGITVLGLWLAIRRLGPRPKSRTPPAGE